MLRVIDRPSPNHGPRPDGVPVDMLVLHYTGMRSGPEAIERLCDPAAQVSSHYVVEEDGTIFLLVPEDRRAWHAGVSCWRDQRDVNSRSIGIEIVNPGHEFGYRPFPEAQMAAVVGLCRGILARHPIPPGNVVGHSDVAPARKDDPGELFDWPRLAAAGIGLWPPHGTAWDGTAWDMAGLQRDLARLGYDVPQTGGLDEPTRLVVRAFQRHWRPADFSGTPDDETVARLRALLKLHSLHSARP
ncbi:MAG TPA: N-acetylmuramoyl-L-alanine amidase [Azospirillaceae bacterium]|nr:N-acetylmuramoyl-L-alanine amidase [Azospirillaceae bacterium]